MSLSKNTLSNWAQLQQMLSEKNVEAYIALRLAKPEHQQQLFALFILFQEAYEATETKEPMVGKIKMAWWRERIEEIIAGKVARPHPALLALGADFKYYPELLNILDEFEKLIDGWQPKTFAEIEEFVRKTFGALFAICGKITGTEDADKLGFAYGNLYLLRKFKLNQNMFAGSSSVAEIALENFQKNLDIAEMHRANSAFALTIQHYKKHEYQKRWKLLLKLFMKAKTAL